MTSTLLFNVKFTYIFVPLAEVVNTGGARGLGTYYIIRNGQPLTAFEAQ